MAGRPREFDQDEVLHKAMTAFWERGFAGTSAQDLVDCTGIGRGSLYAAFGSKEHLYHESLALYQREGLEFHRRVFSGPSTVKDRLRVLLEKGLEIDFLPDNRNGCMAITSPLERASVDPVVQDLSRTYVRKLTALFVELFQSGIEAGEFDGSRSAEERAKSFICSYFGYRTLARMLHDRECQKEAIDALIHCL